MKSGARDEAEGKWHKVKGKVKEIAGELSDDPNLEAEGTNEKNSRQSSGKDRSGQEGSGEVSESGVSRMLRRLLGPPAAVA